MITDPAKTFGSAVDKFIEPQLVVSKYAQCPEGTIRDGGVEDVHGGLGESAFGGVVNAKGDGKREREARIGG